MTDILTPQEIYAIILEREQAEVNVLPSSQERVHLVAKLNIKRDKIKLNIAADNILKEWARTYRMGDRRQILIESGGLVTKSSTPNNNSLDDQVLDHVCLVINQMTDYSRMFVWRHYVTRLDDLRKMSEPIRATVRDIYEGSAPSDFEERLKKYCQNRWLQRIGMPKSTYGNDLRDAKYEFVIRGGL